MIHASIRQKVVWSFWYRPSPGPVVGKKFYIVLSQQTILFFQNELIIM